MSDSLNALVEALQDIVDKVKDGTPQGLANTATRVLADAVPRAPVDLGPLRGSGFVDVGGAKIAHGNADGSITVTGTAPSGATSATIGFDEIYAHRQHEEVGWNHPKGGQAKYLETAIDDLLASGDIEEILADTLWGDD